MGPFFVRLALLVAGLALGEDAFTSLAVGAPLWAPEMGLAMVLIVAGSAGFMVPLLGVSRRKGSTNG